MMRKFATGVGGEVVKRGGGKFMEDVAMGFGGDALRDQLSPDQKVYSPASAGGAVGSILWSMVGPSNSSNASPPHTEEQARLNGLAI